MLNSLEALVAALKENGPGASNDLQVLNQGINIESIATPRSFGPECYDVTTARTMPDADFQAVTLTPRTSPASYW